MIKNMRDFVIFLLVVYVLSVALWVRVYPTSVGEWKAQMDIGYDMIWSEYLMDYTCGEEN